MSARSRGSRDKYFHMVRKVADLQDNLDSANLVGRFSIQALALEFVASKGLLSNATLSLFSKLLTKEVKMAVKGDGSKVVSEFDKEVMAYVKKLYSSTLSKLNRTLKTKEQKAILKQVCLELDPDYSLILCAKNKEPLPFSSIFTALAIVEMTEVNEEIRRLKATDIKLKLREIPYVVKQSFINFVQGLADKEAM
jgi:hypothetical protein